MHFHFEMYFVALVIAKWRERKKMSTTWEHKIELENIRRKQRNAKVKKKKKKEAKCPSGSWQNWKTVYKMKIGFGVIWRCRMFDFGTITHRGDIISFPIKRDKTKTILEMSFFSWHFRLFSTEQFSVVSNCTRFTIEKNLCTKIERQNE